MRSKTLKETCIKYIVNDKTGIYTKAVTPTLSKEKNITESPENAPNILPEDNEYILPNDLVDELKEANEIKNREEDKQKEADWLLSINTGHAKRGFGSCFQ